MRKQFFDMPFGTLLLARRISTVMFFALCSMLIAPRFPVEAQQPKKVPRIGFLTLLRRKLYRLGPARGYICGQDLERR
jgi:hypothetical protein